MFDRKQKLAGLSTRCFILSFFLRNVLKTVGKPLQLLTMHPKLIFRSALKKALIWINHTWLVMHEPCIVSHTLV